MIFVEHTDPSELTERTFHLVGWNEHHYDPGGTAFLLTPTLLVTAKHVVDEYWKKLDPREEVGAGGHGEFSCTALQEHVGGKTVRYEVRKVWSPRTHWMDLAILALDRPAEFSDGHAPAALSFSAIPPQIGEPVFAFGYHRDKATVGDEVITLARARAATFGVVKALHPLGRGGHLSWPCFEVNARFEGGMSGGPVFNERGEVVGLICTGMAFADPDAEPLSYVTMIWPMFAVEIDHPEPDLQCKYPILELARKGVVAGRGWESISLRRSETGDVVGVAIDE